MAGVYTPPESTTSDEPIKISYCGEKWREALDTCHQYLGETEFEHLKEIDSSDKLLADLSDFKDAVNRITGPQLVQRLRPVLDPLRSFVTLLVASLGSTTIQTAVIWGIMSLVIHAAARTETLLPETVDMLRDLGHNLEIFQIYESTFASNAAIGDELMDIFVNIINFWAQAIQFLRRNKRESPTGSSWAQVRANFEQASKHIRKRSQQLKEKVKALALMNRQSDLLKELDRLGYLNINSHAGPSEESLFPCNNIPFPVNPHFCGRQRELQAIRDHLDKGAFSGFSSFALYGTGGIGKTQTALSYAHERANNGVDAVLWLNCETGLAIARSFYEIAAMLRLEGLSEDESSDKNRFLVLKWLRTTASSWLIIMDNVEMLDIIRKAWPIANHGAILVTSRNDIVSLDPAAGGLEIEVFRKDEGASILTVMIGREKYSDLEKDAARKLSARLGGLALALAVMASQIRLRRKSIAEFLSLYEKHPRQLNKERRGIESYYELSLASCWSTAFESLSEKASALLGIIAYIAPDSIPEVFFKPKDPSALPPNLSFCEDEWNFAEALDELLSTSLVKREPSTEMLFTHRLVQDEYRGFMSKDGQQQNFERASQLLHAGFPKLLNGLPLRNHWSQCKLYIQHVLILCARYQESKFRPKAGEFDLLLDLFCSCGWYLMESGAWSEEIELMRTAMEICEDKEGLVYANLANSLGCMECERGHVADAYKYTGAGLQIRQTLLPSDHVEIANSLNNYANIVFLEMKDGACEKALTLYKDCIDICMKHEDHRKNFLHVPHTNMSRVTRILKRFDESIENANISRQYAVAQLGADCHFDGLADYQIGNVCFEKEQYDEAEKYWTLALEKFKKENDIHPSTNAAKFKLSCIHMRRKNYVEAIDMLQTLLVIAELNEESKGDKGEIARITRKLAEAFELKGEYETARDLKKSAESMRREIQGDRFTELPDTDLSYAMMSFHAFW